LEQGKEKKTSFLCLRQSQSREEHLRYFGIEPIFRLLLSLQDEGSTCCHVEVLEAKPPCPVLELGKKDGLASVHIVVTLANPVKKGDFSHFYRVDFKEWHQI
jgi:hypothetical protein